MPPLELGAILNELAQKAAPHRPAMRVPTALLALRITDSKELFSDGPRPQRSHTNSDYARQNPYEFFKNGDKPRLPGGRRKVWAS